MFCSMKPFVYLLIAIICCVAQAQDNNTSEAADRDALMLEFTNEESYSKRIEIFSKLVADPNQQIIMFFTEGDNLSFKRQLLHFLKAMTLNRDLDESTHIAILSHILTLDRTILNPLESLVHDHLAPYISQDKLSDESVNRLLTNKNIAIDFQELFLKEYLTNNICNPAVITSSKQLIKNSNLNMSTRIEILQSFFKVCSEYDNFQETVVSLAIEPSLEWALKEKALLQANKSNTCSNEIIDHLLWFFYEDLNWHIRDAVIWILTQTERECSQKIVTFFSDFVQKNMKELRSELLEFRQIKIQSVLWALVHLGINNPLAVNELKKMAMKHDMNNYFRIRAVEALQDLSLYLEPAAQALYEIARDNRRITQSDFVTYDQQIRDDRDTEVRDSACLALTELVEKERTDFLSFLFIHRERLDAEQLYRKKAFSNQTIPVNLDIYAHPTLVTLTQDEKVDQQCRNHAMTVLEQAH